MFNISNLETLIKPAKVIFSYYNGATQLLKVIIEFKNIEKEFTLQYIKDFNIKNNKLIFENVSYGNFIHDVLEFLFTINPPVKEKRYIQQCLTCGYKQENTFESAVCELMKGSGWRCFGQLRTVNTKEVNVFK